MAIAVRDTNELVRILYKHQFPHNSKRVQRTSCEIQTGTQLFTVELHIIERAIKQGFLIPVENDPNERFELNCAFIEGEWTAQEDARIQAAVKVLNSLYPKEAETFGYKGYRTLLNPRCMEHDTRGFVFSDNKQENEYLVTEGGKIMAIYQNVLF